MRQPGKNGLMMKMPEPAPRPRHLKGLRLALGWDATSIISPGSEWIWMSGIGERPTYITEPPPFTIDLEQALDHF